MSSRISNALGGEHATAQRGGLDVDAIAFIREKSAAGVSPANIARMLGRPASTITRWVPRPDHETESLAALAPMDGPNPQPKEVLSLYKGVIRRPPAVQSTQAMNAIALEVATYYGVSVEGLLGQSRLQALTVPRQALMWHMVEARRWSLPQIGRFIGDRDHTTIIHGCRRHAERLAQAALVAQEAA